MVHVQIFLSSPGDVAEARTRVHEALLGLQRNPFVREQATIDVVRWDDPYAPAPMDARLTPQQAVNASLPTPAECDLTIVLLWSRFGTPLTEKRADGTPYLSGTEWEFQNAIEANKPVFLYRCTAPVSPDKSDPRFDEKSVQSSRVDAFFDAMKGPDGSMLRSWTDYQTVDELVARVQNDVLHCLQKILKTDGVGAAPRANPDGQIPRLSVPAAPASLDGLAARASSERGKGEADDWFKPEDQPVNLYIADAFGNAADRSNIVACIVVHDVPVFERQWQEAIARMQEDPLAHAEPAMQRAIERRRLEYGHADAEMRRLIARALRALAFEAYVSFTRGEADMPSYETLVRGVVFDRLRDYRLRKVIVSLHVADEQRRANTASAVEASARSVRGLHAAAAEGTVKILSRALLGDGGLVARYVAAIVRERIVRGDAAREFNAIYPYKVRVLLDADNGRRYTRHDPYAE